MAAQKALNAAIAAFNDKRYEEAYTLWTDNVEAVVEEHRADVHVNRGKAKQALHDLDAALACFAAALAITPAHVGAMRGRTAEW